MKVVKKKDDSFKIFTLRIDEAVMGQLDNFVKKEKVSKMRLAEAVIKTSLKENHFKNEENKVYENTGRVRTLTLRLKLTLIKRIDSAANKCDCSRQQLVESILQKALSDKSFIVEVIVE
ncbi:hypothetical protein N9O57_00865 [bacterium]|nr:hypothetical protein [bacterium]